MKKAGAAAIYPGRLLEEVRLTKANVNQTGALLTGFRKAERAVISRGSGDNPWTYDKLVKAVDAECNSALTVGLNKMVFVRRI